MRAADIIDFAALGLQADALRDTFAQSGRIRIANFLTEATCASLDSTLKTLDWRLVLNDAHGRHVDLPPSQLKRLGSKAVRTLKQDAQKRSLKQFQYLYENYPIYDRIKGGQMIPAPLGDIYTALNGREYLDAIAGITNRQIDFCDIQATRYRSGHMLTQHNDDVHGKNRQCAFVLSMCPNWHRKWGGNLEFLDAGGAVTDVFTPAYNTLSIFSVPVDHRVSRVKASVLGSRYSLTGWLRHGTD